MTIAFADIEDKFGGVFGFIQDDLERILTLDPGGNFAVATLLPVLTRLEPDTVMVAERELLPSRGSYHRVPSKR